MDEQQNLKPVTENVAQAIQDALKLGASDLVSPEEYIFTLPVWITLIALTLYTFFLVRKSTGTFLQKLVAFLTCHFLITGEYDYAYTIPMPGLDLQPDRLLFLSLLGILFYDAYLTRKKEPLLIQAPKFAWFEIFLVLYAGYNILSQFFHINDLAISDIVVKDMYQLYVVVAYFALKKYANQELVRLVAICMIIGAVITSLISILQFVIDPLFMRIGDYRIAFAPFLRANGTFTNEYYNAYFIIAGFVWSAIYIQKVWFRHLLMGLFILAVFLSFQRMSWIILILVSAFYFFKVLDIRYEIIALLGTGAAIILISVVLIFSQDIMRSQIVTHRLSEKPSGRLGYWTMVLKTIGKSPYWGYGGTESKTYYKEMLKVTRSRVRATAAEGDLHSGYMSSLFYFGVPSFVFFVLMVITGCIYFVKWVPKHRFFAIPFCLALMYLVANISNTLLFEKYLSMLYAIHLGIGMAARKNPEILNFLSITPLAQQYFKQEPIENRIKEQV